MLGTALQFATTFFQGRQEEGKQKRQAHIEQKRIDAQAQLHSWKDEYALLIVTIPFIMCFIPGFAEYARAGFDNLSSMPEWYQNLVILALASSLGLKTASGFLKGKTLISKVKSGVDGISNKDK